MAPDHAQASTEENRSAWAKSTTMADRDNQYRSSSLSLGPVGFVSISQANENKNVPWAELGTGEQRKEIQRG